MNAHSYDLVYLYSSDDMGAHDHQEAGSLSSQKGVALYPPMHKMFYQSKY